STKPVQTNATVLRRFLPGVNRQRQRKPGRCVRLHIPLVEKTELKSQRFHHKCAHKRRVVSMHDGRFVQRQKTTGPWLTTATPGSLGCLRHSLLDQQIDSARPTV
ncbi:hypothetical protein LSAT2_002216, partial [Lamellibrachia satsuma]